MAKFRKINRCNVAIIALLVILISSCEDSYYTTIDELQKASGQLEGIVIQGAITTEKKYHFVDISLPSYFTEKSDGVVMKPDSVLLVSGALKYEYIPASMHCCIDSAMVRESLYISKERIAGRVAREYTLKVLYEDVWYTATDSLNPVAPIDLANIELPEEVSLGHVTGGSSHTLGVAVNLFGFNPPHYYTWYGDVLENVPTYTFRHAGLDVQGSYIGAEQFAAAILVKKGGYDTIRVHKHSISRQYDQYLIEVAKQTSWKDPFFSVSPGNVVSNVEPFGYGFFSASDVTKDTTNLEEIRRLHQMKKSTKMSHAKTPD